MAECHLASGGDDIRIWDCNSSFSLVKQYNPHSHNISCLNWSHDNQLLASSSSGGDKVIISLAKANVFKTAVEFGIGENKTCISFNSSSQNLIAGGKDGTVTLWEIRSQKTRKSYKSHKGSVTSAQFNWNDTYVASGAESGEILLYNVITGVESSPLIAPRTQAVRELQFSYFKKSLLACVSDDGAVNLWDTNTRRHIHPFRDVHKAPATGLAFSPLNDMLLLSVGLDKRIVCYDVLGKNPVKTITAESPLTSVDLQHNGVTLAVGSTRGKIYIYDLRNNSGPVHTISCAHKSSVQFLSFQNKIRAAKPGTSLRTRSSTPSSTRPASAPVLEKESITTPAPRAQTPSIKSLTDRTNTVEKSPLSRVSENGSFDAISPLREVNETVDGHRKKSDLSVMSENRPELAKPTPKNTSSVSRDSTGLFSPLTQGKFLDNSLERQHPIGAGLYSPINPQPMSSFDCASVNSSQDFSSKVNSSQELNSTKVNSSNDVTSKVTSSLGFTSKVNSSIDLSSKVNSSDLNNAGSSPHDGRRQTDSSVLPNRKATETKSVIPAEQNYSQKITNGYSTLLNGLDYSPPSRDSADRQPDRMSPEKAKDPKSILSSTPTISSDISPDQKMRRGRASPKPRSLSRLGGKRDNEGHMTSFKNNNPPVEGAQIHSAMSDWDFLTTTRTDVQTSSRDITTHDPQLNLSAHAEKQDSGRFEKSYNAVGCPQGKSVADIAGQVTSNIVDGLEQRGLAGAGDGALFSPVHVEFMKTLIKDSMEEFRDQVHADIKNMHYELIRQFSIQLEQMKEIMHSYSVNGELVSEIECLREENRRLKKNY